MGAIGPRVSKDGQVLLPNDLRKALGVEQGGDVLAVVDGRQVNIGADAGVEEARRILANTVPKGARLSVDDFLAQRPRDTGE